MPTRLDLLVPGLFGPVPRPVGTLRTPTLDLLLDRATPVDSTGDDLTSVVLSRFGAAASAPYALAADDPDWDGRGHRGGWWLHADPVHLRPDRDLLRLFDAPHLGISRTEADALVAELNRHFAEDGLSFCAPAADRWYLHCAEPPAIDTVPLARVRGRHIGGFLPAGADARRWAALMSEAQMLLFQSPVNRAREAAGRPGVNGLWCWGGGTWRPPATPPTLAVGSLPLLRGLAAAAGIACRDLPGVDAAELTRGSERVLVVWDALDDALRDRDEDAWAGAVDALERWVRRLPAALRSGGVGELCIDDCGGARRAVRGKDLGWSRRLFRRRRPLLERAVAVGQGGPAAGLTDG
jgi:hypothetical protein